MPGRPDGCTEAWKPRWPMKPPPRGDTCCRCRSAATPTRWLTCVEMMAAQVQGEPVPRLVSLAIEALVEARRAWTEKGPPVGGPVWTW